MPDFSDEILKFNPAGAGRPSADINDPASDWSGYAVAGGPMGLWAYKKISEILAEAGEAIATPSPINHVTAEGRFTDADAAGKYILGHGVKAASGTNAPSPMQVFPASASYLAAYPDQ